MGTMIFLGAGASAAEGAPIQGAILKEYAKSILKSEDGFLDHNVYAHHNAIPSMFRSLFGIDIRSDDLDTIQFPTFEEVLGILDLARIRNESFGYFSYQLGNRPTNYPTIDQLRSVLLDVLSFTLSKYITTKAGVHSKLVKNLNSIGKLNGIIFATTNYDTFLDNALASAVGTNSVNYGWEVSHSPMHKAPAGPTLLKVHGSLDWLFCQSCLAVRRASDDINRLEFGVQCKRCEDFMHPLIVPPTFFKEMNDAVLSAVWRSFEEKLRDTEHVIFCGYSFPDADMHIKYAFKRREIVGNPKSLEISVVNNHAGKEKLRKDEEESRFSRFFTCKVNYTNLSFDEFAIEPNSLISM